MAVVRVPKYNVCGSIDYYEYVEIPEANEKPVKKPSRKKKEEK